MKSRAERLFLELNPYEIPIYSVPEAARYLRLVPNTLRYWVMGRQGVAVPVIRAQPGAGYARLSFNNLIEAYVLSALRKYHEVSLPKIREAIDYAETEMGVSRLLISPELKAAAGELFLDRYTNLVNLTRRGQLAIKRILQSYLERVEYEDTLPKRLFPPLHPIQSPSDKGGPTAILIDPKVGFGKPITCHRHIRTSILAERYDAGESVQELAEDYGLRETEVEEAISYEAFAA